MCRDIGSECRVVGVCHASTCTHRKLAYTHNVLQVFKLVDDPDKTAKCLVNLSNLYELQVRTL
jgi:hypothetical protein